MEKVEAGRFELRTEVFDPADLVPETLRMLEVRAEKGGVVLDSTVADNLPPIEADRRVVRQMLLNLLSNAVKFTDSGGCITLRADHCKDGGVMFAVSDTGIGMDEGDLEKAMAPFGQADNDKTRMHEGTGLGLPLVQSLIDLHGGRMAVDTAPGIGTTVSLCFPPERVVAGSKSKTAPGGAVLKSV